MGRGLRGFGRTSSKNKLGKKRHGSSSLFGSHSLFGFRSVNTCTSSDNSLYCKFSRVFSIIIMLLVAFFIFNFFYINY